MHRGERYGLFLPYFLFFAVGCVLDALITFPLPASSSAARLADGCGPLYCIPCFIGASWQEVSFVSVQQVHKGRLESVSRLSSCVMLNSAGICDGIAGR